MINQDSRKSTKINPGGRPTVDPEAGSRPTGSTRFAFTKRKLESLPLPREGRTYYNDTTERGLQLKVFPTGRKTFALYRKVSGKPERITIGPFPDITVEQARNRARELNGDIAKGRNPARERAAIRAEMTLEQMFQEYLENHAKVHKRRWKDDVSMFNLHLHSLHLRRISEIGKSDLAALHRRIGRRAPYAANRVMELVSSMFNRAIEESGWTGENPAAGIKAFKEHKRQRFLDAEELPRFFQSLADEPNLTIRDFILACLLTGARRRNVSSMRWDEIRWGRAVWEIPGPKAKGSKPIDVLLIPTMMRLLEQRQKSLDADPTFVFAGKGASGHLQEPKSAWKRILRRAHIRDCRLHDLRRTLGSWQAIGGSSLPVIGASLGHQSLAATQIYARLHSDPVRASVLAATDRMLEAAPVGLLPALPGQRGSSGITEG